MNKEVIPFLNQLAKTLEEAEIKLEEAYGNNDYDRLIQTKKFMLEIQKKISDTLK